MQHGPKINPMNILQDVNIFAVQLREPLVR
jgi:hypothetical protein